MNISMQQRQSFNVLLIILLALTIILSGCASTQTSGLTSPEGALYVKGKVAKITTRDDSTTIKITSSKGDVVIVQVTPDTMLGNLRTIKEISKHNPLEVHYRVDGDNNIAVKLTLLPQGTCD